MEQLFGNIFVIVNILSLLVSTLNNRVVKGGVYNRSLLIRRTVFQKSVASVCVIAAGVNDMIRGL